MQSEGGHLNSDGRPISDAESRNGAVAEASVHVSLNDEPLIKGLAADMTYEERLAGEAT
jgi:hypothetical protein